MATAAMFVLPIPTFLVYLVPLTLLQLPWKQKNGDSKKLIPFIKLHEIL
jgi:hypothetical protein